MIADGEGRRRRGVRSPADRPLPLNGELSEPAPPHNPLIDQRRVCELTGLSPNKVSALVRAGVIPSTFDADGARVLHEAEVIAWRDHGRTPAWCQAVQGRGGVTIERLLEALVEAFARVLAEPTVSGDRGRTW